MTRKRQIVIAAGLTAAGMAAGFAFKALAEGIPSPSPLFYSGTLTENGVLVNDSNHTIGINLYADATSTSTICQTTINNVPISNGRFRIPLSSGCKAAINASPDAQLEVFDGTVSLGGRSPIGAVPYAIEAEHAVNATNATNATTAANCPIVTDWQSYTPVLTALNAGTPVANATSTGKYRRVGDSAEFLVQTVFSNAPNSSATLWAWTLPPNMKIDSTKLEGSSVFIGGGMAQQAIGQNVALEVTNRSSTSVSATANGAATYYINDSQPFDWAANGQMQIYFTVPVVGWTSNK